ncbi:hypothetical protein I601_1072 [Nocardioides dokdonensis FR1436]|uniref:Uncharacterized protein n=1 Tax=Nocardioides dokdonensis FR1436 TaxID=1300347 RepID=A0A1A9GH04_9ACTN|nr:hypothetical protein [Nocardioides dokdonensis]ANH37514.1 hypothetical protein I601_1072 [Nocardioides dokdonensis FR1436]
MSTVDDLRSTLEDHAHGVQDPGATPRVVAVHERVRGLRRRRRTTAGALAAVVALAGVGIGVQVLGDRQTGPEPAGAPRTLADQEVPATVTILGRGYEYVEGIDLDTDERVATVRLPRSDGPRAVSLAASGLGEGAATLELYDSGVARAVGAGSLESPVPVGAEAARLRVVLEGVAPDAEVGLAVYERADEGPTGVVAPNGTTHFRDEVAGNPLIAGAFAEPGASELEMSFELDRPTVVRFATTCASPTKGVWVQFDIDDQPGWSRGACGDEGVEDASGSWGSMADPLEPGTHTVRARLTRGAEGDPVEDPAAVLGVGAYGEPETVQRSGLSVDVVVEHDGRLWRLDETLPAVRDGRPVTHRVSTEDEPRLVGFNARGGIVGMRVEAGRAGTLGLTNTLIGAGRGGSSLSGQLLRGDDYELSLYDDRGGSFDGTILLYRPVG